MIGFYLHRLTANRAINVLTADAVIEHSIPPGLCSPSNSFGVGEKAPSASKTDSELSSYLKASSSDEKCPIPQSQSRTHALYGSNRDCPMHALSLRPHENKSKLPKASGKTPGAAK